jgi:membrane protein required for colicin V production
MGLFDFILLLLLFGFIWFGFWFGIIRTLGALIGVAVGALIASRYYDVLAPKVIFLFWENMAAARIISFVLIYLVANRLTGFVFYIIDRMFRIVSWLPFLSGINRIGGAILGFVEGSFTLGLILYFMAKFPLGEWLTKALENSNIAPKLIRVAKILLPLLPEALKQLQSLI